MLVVGFNSSFAGSRLGHNGGAGDGGALRRSVTPTLHSRNGADPGVQRRCGPADIGETELSPLYFVVCANKNWGNDYTMGG